MGYKCAIQFLGLTRQENPKGKHRANGKKILLEMGDERYSKTENLDKDKSDNNRFFFDDKTSGETAWQEMEDFAGKYKSVVKVKGKEHVRNLRNDAVIGCSCIINPPTEICVNWSDEEYEKFYTDSINALYDFKSNIFRKENIKFGVEHRDEGKPGETRDFHLHVVFQCLDKKGKYCGNKIDSRFMSDFHKFYPAYMREKGWVEMEDLNTTDWDLFNDESNVEYRNKRLDSWNQHDDSANEHALKKMEENVQKTEENLDESKQILSDIENEKIETENEKREIIFDAQQYSFEVKKQADSYAKSKKSEADSYSKKTKSEADSYASDVFAECENTLRKASLMLQQISILYEDLKANLEAFSKLRNRFAKGSNERRFIDRCLETDSTLNAYRGSLNEQLNQLSESVESYQVQDSDFEDEF